MEISNRKATFSVYEKSEAQTVIVRTPRPEVFIITVAKRTTTRQRPEEKVPIRKLSGF